jgi:NitT/TauT family transport system ATP-binding protein
MSAQGQVDLALAEDPADQSVRTPRAAAPAALRYENVAVTYPGRRPTQALRDFSMQLGSGERVAVVGPSGCGKSTLLALAAGQLAPTEGTVSALEEVALMPQRDLLVPWRSAVANAALALEAQGVPRREALGRAAPMFERFGLGSFENSKIWELSGGMRQRVAFLRTVLTGRPLLALDEPFGALDSITRGEMQDWLLEALSSDPRTLLLVTHDIDEALVLADRVVVMTGRPGRVATELTVDRPSGIDRTHWLTSTDFAELKAQALEVLA